MRLDSQFTQIFNQEEPLLEQDSINRLRTLKISRNRTL